MQAKLLKPCSNVQRANFIIQYDYQLHKHIVETNTALYALEPWEYIENDQVIEDREGYEERKRQEEKEAKRREILKQLDSLDLKSIRAIRANDEKYIAQYEAQAEELRKQLKELSGE